ncbi:GTPase-activating protein [Scheffersomyces coipomensis]|uniref:GTPase-activating protein n=1 Tax=Scheffersomyces coipomensis TaxID=1788519 RepID=UPI00315DB7B1
MSYPSPFHRIILNNKGLFEGKDFLVSTDTINWIHTYTLTITEHGQLYSSDENDNHYLLLQSLQSCYVQIFPTLTTNTAALGPTSSSSTSISSSSTRRFIASKRSMPSIDTSSSSSTLANESHDPPVIFIKTYENDKLYLKVASKSNFGNLISSLIVWQSLKPQGLVKKWYSENKVDNSTINSKNPHELLVCRFKIYAPVPSKAKNLNFVTGPRAPVYQAFNDVHVNSDSNPNNINESWFYVMGVLKSNGMLNFITELDGTLLYSIDIKSIMSSEIRQMHHSIFDNSNVLFLGQLKELRSQNISSTSSFLIRDGKLIPNNYRIFIEFPLHIDLEDWFVGLNYFAKREYIGSYSPKSKLLISASPSSTTPPPLLNFSREHFRVSKKISIDIIEAKFDQVNSSNNNHNKIYAEVRMWGLPWSRTAMVKHSLNPFWKEEFSTDLPISTQMIHILIKKCAFNDSNYSTGDKIIGTVYVTPDILAKQNINNSSNNNSNQTSTIMIGSNSIPNNLSSSTSNNNLAKGSDIVRLSIYDSTNVPIGKLLINVQLKEHHILPPRYFKSLEHMLIHSPMKDLIKFINDTLSPNEFDETSVMLLDIFQTLGVEEKWFKSLMEYELTGVDVITRKNYAKTNSEAQASPAIPASTGAATTGTGGGNTSSSNNVFNTLFRGSSIFSKSLEKYNLRIGQEYLEKVFGNFILKIVDEKKNCEVDPRYVRIQERLLRKGKPIDYKDDEDNDSDKSSNDDSEEEDESYDEDASEQVIKVMLENNFNNLYQYAEELWHNIYITSNDLPDQIKTQLKNFRNKVELACDPDDKTTPLNCLSAFIFLRFFCPAILNPKLFYLTKHHQSGLSQRTLTLLAKILLNLANRQEFSPHKEPHLVKMNAFLIRHQQEVFDYFDRITGRRNDFNEKILELSHEVNRFDLGLKNDSTSNELPTTPYLIDKYLRLTQVITLLDYNRIKSTTVESPKLGNGTGNTPIPTPTTTTKAVTATPYNGRDSISTSTINRESSTLINNGVDNLSINDEKNVYQIGSLEFEKSEFLDLAGDNETEGFIKSLCRDNDNIFSFINSNIGLKDLQKQCTKLMTKIDELEVYLENFEFPANYLPNNQPSEDNEDDDIDNDNDELETSSQVNNNSIELLWSSFTYNILSKCYVDMTTNSLVYVEKENPVPNIYKKLIEQNPLSTLKLKFNDSNGSLISSPIHAGSRVSSSSFTNSNIGNILKPASKNPFKKWLGKS